MEEYIDFTFAHMSEILGSYGTSYSELVGMWGSKVAMEFGYPVQKIIDLYSSKTDTHDSEMRTRYMFKWLLGSKHQAGTPWAYVNGVLLETFPTKAEDWMDMLNSVYQSQWKPKTI